MPLAPPASPQPIATKIREEKKPAAKIPPAKIPSPSQPEKFSPCKKCRSPIFWFSIGGTGPHCVDCEPPAEKLLIRKVAVVEKITDEKFQGEKKRVGEYRLFPIGDLPSFGIKPLSIANEIAGEITTNLDACPWCAEKHQGGPENCNHSTTSQPSDGLLAFLDADGATHIRLARFARDKSLQRQDETRDEYEQRLRDNEQIVKYGDTLKKFAAKK